MLNINPTRTDSWVLNRWWWTIDRWLLSAFLLLALIGTMLIAAASPPVAERIGLGSYHFIYRHIFLLCASLILMFAVSALNQKQVRVMAFFCMLTALILVVTSLLFGTEIKGAYRWIQLPGFSLQPSEFLKPSFAIIAAWLFTRQKQEENFAGNLMSAGLYVLIVSLLLMQPDLGMAVLVSIVWFAQFFLAGLPLIAVGVLLIAAITGLAFSYYFLPHVQERINIFLDPSSGDSYQIERSLEAFMNGGLFGTGPGQGTVKMLLPDAHADFIFAVAGEEMGFVFCVFLLLLFAFIVLRGFAKTMKTDNLFSVLAVGGLLTQFGAQALINMGSALHLIPTKGMTMPFISYGGSSLLSIGLAAGIILALTRKYGEEKVQ